MARQELDRTIALVKSTLINSTLNMVYSCVRVFGPPLSTWSARECEGVMYAIVARQKLDVTVTLA